MEEVPTKICHSQSDAPLIGDCGLGASPGLLLAVACSGCMVGPDYKSPAVLVANQYLEAHQPSVDTKREQYVQWWRVFNDPVLDRLIQIAYDQNLSLVAAGTQVLKRARSWGWRSASSIRKCSRGNGTLITSARAMPTDQFPVNVISVISGAIRLVLPPIGNWILG